MDTENKNIRVGAILGYILQFVSIAISFIYVPIMLKKLGQEEYGLYAIVQSLVSYLNLTDIGIGTTAIRYNAKFIATHDIEGQKTINGMFFIIYSAIAFICVIAGAVLFFFLDKIYISYDYESIVLIQRLFIIAVINLVITFVFKIYNSIIAAHEKFIFTRVLSIIQAIVNPACLLLVLYFGYKSIGMLIATTILNLVSGLIQLIYAKYKLNTKFSYKNIKKSLFFKVMTFTLFIFLNTLASQLFKISDKLIVSIVMDAASVALLAVVLQLEDYFYSFSNIITSLYMPRLTKITVANNNDSNELLDVFSKIGRIQALIAVFIYGGIVACGKAFINRWLGAEYSEVYILLIVVLFPQIFGAAQSMFTQLMQAKNLHKTRSIIGIVIAVVKLIATIPFVIYFGLIGCAIAYAIMYIIRLIIYHFYYKKVSGFNVDEYFIKMFKIYIPLLIIMAVTVLPIIFIPSDGYLSIFLCAMLYSFLFLLVYWFIIANKSEKQQLKSFIYSFMKKIKIAKEKD